MFNSIQALSLPRYFQKYPFVYQFQLFLDMILPNMVLAYDIFPLALTARYLEFFLLQGNPGFYFFHIP